jgi:hypothetical protein
LQFRDAKGMTHAEWLSDIGLLIVDRGGVFSDFNQAERFMAGNEAERAVVRYRRTMTLAEDFWPEVITARLAIAYDRTGQLDEGVRNLVRMLRGKRTGAGTAARLLPRTIPEQRDGAVVRALETLDAAIARPLEAAAAAVLRLLRYEILRKSGDPRAASLAPEAAGLAIPEPARSDRLYEIQLAAQREMATAAGLDAAVLLERIDQAIRDCPMGSLPSFLLLKGEVLLATAASREAAIEAAWPFLRVVVHFPTDPRAADALLGAAQALERLGRKDQAASLLRECMTLKQAGDGAKARADEALRRIEVQR